MSLGFDLDAGSIPDFGDFVCNANYAAGTTNAYRGETPLHYYVYVWDIRDGSGPEILDVLDSDNGMGAGAFITNENELIVRNGGMFGSPTNMLVYDASDFTLLQTIPIAPYLTDDDLNMGFSISEVTVGGDKYLFVQVTPYLGGFRGPYLILKRVGGAWVYNAHHVSDGTTITGYAGISAGTQYAYLRGTTTIGRVQWNGGYSEALISPPSLGARSILYVTYIPATDEVLVITGGSGIGDPTVDALVYSPDLSTLKRSATVYGSFSTGLRNTDSGMLVDTTVAAVPLVAGGSFRISNFVLFDTVTMTVVMTVDVDPDGDYVNQVNPYNYCMINDEHIGAGVMPAGSPQHLSFWPFPYVPPEPEPEPEPEPLPDVCPIEGVGIDECIVGQTSMPLCISGYARRICVPETEPEPTTYEYIAVEVMLMFDLTNFGYFDEPPPPAVITPPQPYNTGDNAYWASIPFKYRSSNPILLGRMFLNCYINYDGTWTFAGDFEQTGMPEELVYPFFFDLAADFGVGQVTDGGGNPDPDDPEFLNLSPSVRYIDPIGGTMTTSVPFEDAIFFEEGPAAIEVWHHSAVFAEHFPLWSGSFDPTWCYQRYGHYTTEMVASWPPSDMTIDYNGKTYTLAGAKAVLHSSFSSSAYQVRMPGGTWEAADNHANLFILMKTPVGVGAGGGTSTIPVGAVAHMEFDTGFYYSGGVTTQPIGDLLGSSPDPVSAGGQFNPGAIIPTRGMVISYDGHSDAETEEAWDNRPYAIGTLFDEISDAVLNGGRIVFHVTCQYEPYGPLLGCYDEVSDDDTFDWVNVEMGNLNDGYDLDLDAPMGASANSYSIDITFNEDIGGGNRRYTVVIDGGTPVTQDVTYATPFPSTTLSYITLGHNGADFAGDPTYIRTITVYPP